MLQINCGKLFTSDEVRTNNLTGVLYSNARIYSDKVCETEAGTIRSADSGHDVSSILYELVERLEGPVVPGALISQTVKPFLIDFAVVASFALNVVVDPTQTVVQNLTNGRPGFSSSGKPSDFVARFFDPQVALLPTELDQLADFVRDLLALKRTHFRGAMRAMRTYVAGLHAIPGDPGLGYTLLVSAAELLAQDFDGHVTGWHLVEQSKRTAIDKALARAAHSTRQAVRNAVLASEHVSIGRRYRAFILAQIGDDFFRRDEDGIHIARFELEEALRHAYELRSAYVHLSKSLPDPLLMPFGRSERTTIERRPALTFQGLSRLTREAIFAFVRGGPKVEREVYDYRRERYGVRTAQVAPQHWVFLPITDAQEGRFRLEGLLSLAASCDVGESGAAFVDMRPALADAERLLRRARKADRAALLGLHFLYNMQVAEEYRTPAYSAFRDKHFAGFNVPSVLAMVVATAAGLDFTNDLEEHRGLVERYFVERVRPKGLHAPRLYETALWLVLAERYRTAGDIPQARAAIAAAVETYPGKAALRSFESDFDGAVPIIWRDILCRKPDAVEADDTSA